MRVYFTHLGCKLNEAEIERWARQFTAAGWSIAQDVESAALHVVHSCTVTAEAERSSRKALGRGGRRRDDERPRTVFAGCHASALGADAARMAGVDLVVSNAEKDELLARVERAFPDLRPPAPASAGPSSRAGLDPDESAPCGGGEATSRAARERTRSFLDVEDGCDMRCSFCIIPLVRGRQRSRPLDRVVAEARDLAAAGAPEIVVTGVQISSWRDGDRRLFDLVVRLLDELGPSDPSERSARRPPRLRLSSIAPWEFDRRLLDLFADERLCRHLHLSLQSGDGATLRRMRRPGSPETYAELLAAIRTAVPGIAITTDVIAGFPGETEAQFEGSLAFVEAMRFAKIHAFPFSPRPGTEAATLPCQIPEPVRRQRTARLLEVAANSERRHLEAQVGRRVEVLWERPRRDGRGQGLTGDYVRVLSREKTPAAGRFGWAELVGVERDAALARIS